MTEKAVYAAGGVVWRLVDGKVRVLVIHRTQYADITLPKGKVDPGETLAETAVREIEEETGIRVALGVPVGLSRYIMPKGREKVVHYWAAEATDEAIAASSFVPNKEIAALEWLSLKKARKRLSYPVDLEILENFATLVDHGLLHTFPIIVLRHAKALPRDKWADADSLRPLAARGRDEAKQIVGALNAFAPTRIVSSPAVRCMNTVRPLARADHLRVRKAPGVSQDAWEAELADVRSVVGKLVRDRTPVVLCSHRPVIPTIMNEIALATGTLSGSYLDEASTLVPAAFSVVHLSATNPGSGIITIETHEPKDSD